MVSENDSIKIDAIFVAAAAILLLLERLTGGLYIGLALFFWLLTFVSLKVGIFIKGRNRQQRYI